MNISEKSVKDNLQYIVDCFRRNCAQSHQSHDMDALRRFNLIAYGQLSGIALCFPKFRELVQVFYDEMDSLMESARIRLETQQIATSVEREVFPSAGLHCGKCGRSVGTFGANFPECDDMPGRCSVESACFIPAYHPQPYSGDVGRSPAQSSAAVE